MSENTSPEQQPRQRRQDRRRRQSAPVTVYLMILFIAAFLLLLFAYFQQQRANEAALDNLQQTSNSAVQSIQQLMDENRTLKEQLEEIQSTQETEMAAAQALLAKQRAQVLALSRLNQLRALYNQGKYAAARTFLNDLGETGIQETVSTLEQISADMSEEERTIYDPLSAWQQLTGWLE